MKTEILSKKDAVAQFRKFGVPAETDKAYLGRLYLKIGHFERGVGVCFMTDYRGCLSRQKWLNPFLVRLAKLLPDSWKKNYVIYTRAFSGTHSREAEMCQMEASRYVDFDSPNISFMAAGSEWKLVDGKIMAVDTLKYRVV